MTKYKRCNGGFEDGDVQWTIKLQTHRLVVGARSFFTYLRSSPYLALRFGCGRSKLDGRTRKGVVLYGNKYPFFRELFHGYDQSEFFTFKH